MSENKPIHSMEDLQEFLTTQLQRLTSGELLPSTANAASTLAGKLLSSIKLTMDYNRLTDQPQNLPFLEKTGEVKQIENKESIKVLEHN